MIKRLILTALALSVAAFAQTGGLTVSVQDSSGKALSGARVAITALPLSNPQATATGASTTKAVPAAAASAQLPIYNNSATTGANGVATFASIPAGVYTLCAYPTGQAVVDSCSWVVRPQNRPLVSQ
jgi:hypothetical protein